ncbi:MAG: hypothetical protein Q8R08_03290 [bacterium]|nr:hypothetical protein [bacterium]
MFEIHIALPKLPADITQKIINNLKDAGLPKSKYFLGVHSLPVEGTVEDTPPTGHDLEDPGVMTTLKVSAGRHTIKLVRKGMRVLKSYGVVGNFEIEEILSAQAPEIFELDPDNNLPEFEHVPDSPAYENHIIWKGRMSSLPSNEVITVGIKDVCGCMPHQIVDFAYSLAPQDSEAVTRVATIYQPSRESTLEFGALLSANRDYLRCSYIVSERVHMVGVWVK